MRMKVGYVIASNAVVVQGQPVGYVYREAPDQAHDSGWRVFSGHESPEYIDDPSNFAMYNVSTILEIEPALAQILDADHPVAFERDAQSGVFERVDERDAPAAPAGGLVFTDSGHPLTADDVARSEAILGFRLPEPLRRFYLATNGGVPDRYVYEDANIDTVVSQFLPLHSDAPAGHAVEDCFGLAARTGLVGARFLPFAVDGGGDYFLVDAASANAVVYFYNSDAADESRRLISLHLGLDDFCAALQWEG